MRLSDVTADVKAAKAAGADLVIVMPHWGTEYTAATSTVQRSEAAEIVASGADLILGSHSHWVGPVQSISRSGGPAFVMYSLGDLVFDLNHDVRTQEGVVADLTFVGTRLAQVDLQPTLILDRCQPNLLDPAGDGSTLLNDIRKASAGLLDW
jgi:poly-gamma-glutamate synthesis protein (capsule biosynthesis protein)